MKYCTPNIAFLKNSNCFSDSQVFQDSCAATPFFHSPNLSKFAAEEKLVYVALTLIKYLECYANQLAACSILSTAAVAPAAITLVD